MKRKAENPGEEPVIKAKKGNETSKSLDGKMKNNFQKPTKTAKKVIKKPGPKELGKGNFIHKSKSVNEDKISINISPEKNKKEKQYERNSAEQSKKIDNRSLEVLVNEEKLEDVFFKSNQHPKNKKLQVKTGKKNLEKIKKTNAKDLKNGKLTEKPEDWAEFKKKKKELHQKRKQSKQGFEITFRAKALVEQIRRKSASSTARNSEVQKLHNMLKGKYSELVLAHDTSRLVQCVLKYGSNEMKTELSNEIMGMVIGMMQSKYGKHIVRRMLKHGEPQVRSDTIKAMYGHSVKLSSHIISSPILEYAFSTWASPIQKQHLIQEFYSDMYKNSKDDSVKHMRDVYAASPTLKNAVLSAVKENLQRILNKDLYDSGIVQTLLSQYLTECGNEERAEMITRVAPHIVVIGNSKDGSRAAMQCVWHSTNKDKKVIMKALKENIIDVCKHEYGHCTVIALLDSVDDTVLLHKIILSRILESARDLAQNEWGRKVLVWLVDPASTVFFHPQFISELESGRATSTCKKPVEIRRKELLQYAREPLLELVRKEPEFWWSNASLALEMLSIVKAGSGENLKETYNAVVKRITDPDWSVKHNDKDVWGIEHPGIHMVLKKMAQFDKTRIEKEESTFGEALVELLNDNLVQSWIKCNRGCFLLLTVLENCNATVRNDLKEKLSKHRKNLKKQETAGAKLLIKKLNFG